MRKKIIFAGLVTVFLVVFLVGGMPVLKKIKGTGASLSFGFERTSKIEGRPVQIDVSIEDVCLNLLTGDIEQKCLTKQGCDSVCRSSGCKSFALKYNGSEMQDRRCLCNCLDEI
jgi:hypothetical protein